jgi:phage gp45-like
MLYEHDDNTVPTTRRARIEKVDDAKSQQFVDISGLKNEKPKKIWRPQDYGFSSNPPKESDGIIEQLGGRSDRTVYRDAGHEKYRPKRTPEGGTVLFDHKGDIIRVFPEHLDAVHAKKINIRIGKGYKADDNGANNDANDTSEDDQSSEDTKTISIVLDGDKVQLKYEGSTVTLDEDGHVTCEAATRFAGGVGGGKWVVAKSGRIDLGVSSPDGTAPNAVMTDAGPSSIVFAVV